VAPVLSWGFAASEQPVWRRQKTPERDARFSWFLSVLSMGSVMKDSTITSITSHISRSQRLAMPGSGQQGER
jgi:hypothetical protein